jgi:hypothetical protein
LKQDGELQATCLLSIIEWKAYEIRIKTALQLLNMEYERQLNGMALIDAIAPD